MTDLASDPNAWKRRTPSQALGDVLKSAPLFAAHGYAVYFAVSQPPSMGQLLLAIITCATAGVFVTLCYHRYFSHRSFRTSRVFQFILGVWAELALQKGPLWWAANHRVHHRHVDTDDDPHTPKHGYWWSHMGWTLHPNTHNNRRDDLIKDLLKYPELEWLDRLWLLPPALYMAGLYALGGLPMMMWGYVIPIFAQFQLTYLINSACHIWGTQPFPTKDTSRNSLILALLTMGEGWHNNHHYYQASARQGFFWYEIDVTYWVIFLFERLGLVWNVRRPPQRIYDIRAEHMARTKSAS